MNNDLVAIDNRIKKLISLVLLRNGKDIIDYLATLSKEKIEILGLGNVPIQIENIKYIVEQLHLKWMFMRWQEYGVNQKAFDEGESLIYIYNNPISNTYRKDFETICSVKEIPAVSYVFGIIDECRELRRKACRLTKYDTKRSLDKKIREEEKIQEQQRTI